MGRLGKFQAIVTWEQRKLGKLITEHNELVTGYQFPIATSARTGLFFQTEYFDNGRTDINDGVTFHVVPQNFVTYRYMSDDSIFHFNKNTFDTSVQVSREYPVFTNNDKSNLDFLVMNLNFSGSFLRFSKMQKKGGTRTRLYYKVLQQYRISVPEVDEQDKISTFMNKINQIIALHERKLDLLKELKKAYLQQLFPKNGDKTPQLRFAGFTDDWEQRKLGEVTNHLKSYPLSRNVETSKSSGYRYIHYGDIHTRVADIIKNEAVLPKILLGKYDTIKTGDLCLADASEDYQDIAAPSVLLAEHTDNIVAGLHTIALRPKSVKPLFLYYVFKAPDFRHYVYREGQGLKVFGISASNVFKYKYVFPSVTEQADIIKLLSNLDCAIALHERRLGQLNNLKQAFLQKLYV